MSEKNKYQPSEAFFHRVAMALALVSVVCVLVIFFFPSEEGPYSVVHGPVTVMHAARAAASVRMSVAKAGLTATHSFRDALVLSFWLSIVEVAPLPGGAWSGFGNPLRC
jgi:succinate dehydrogenase hydrophobic anchor subunit